MVNKVQKWFDDIWDRIKTSVRVKPETVFIWLGLILTIALGVLVRLSPIFRGPPLIKAFDPWIQFHSTEYLVNNGMYKYFKWHSFQSWYPEGIDRFNLRPGLVFATAILYNILNFFGLQVSLYEVAYFWPAIMGGFTILAIYYLGKEVLDARCGLLAAFFLAFSPGHIQRTIAGFFDNETIGVFSVLMLFLFFIRSIKTDKMYNSIIAGLFLGFLALSWGGLTYGFLLLPLASFIMILVGKYSARLLVSYVGAIGTGLLVFMINPTFTPSIILTDMEIAIPVLFLFFMIGYHILYVQKTKNPKVYKIIWNIIKWGSIPTLIVFGIIFWVAPQILPFNLNSRAQSIINPGIREAINLVASVGEHKPSPWSVFYYNTLIPVILTPLGVFFAIKRSREEDILMLVFALTLLYFTGSMIRIILLLAPALALIGAYGLTYVMKFFGSIMKKQQAITRRRKRQIRKTLSATEGVIVFVLVGFMFFAQVNHATTVSIDQMSYSELVTVNQLHDWEESLSFVNENLSPGTVVVSWWDYGYWLTVLGNVTTVNDNATLNHTRLGLTGMAMMQTDELYSAKIFKQLGAEYVLVFFGFLINSFGGDEGKWPWMLRICNDYSQQYQSWGLAEDNWYYDEQGQLISVFNEADYINASSGLYEDSWFDSQLVRLMTYNEPTSLNSPLMPLQQTYYQYLANQYAQAIEGNEAQGVAARTDDDGDPWAYHIPPDGDYDFKVFQKYYFSTNHLVKIYKMDYTALESSFEVINPKLSENGIAHADIKNTGERNITITDLAMEIDGAKKSYDFLIEDDDYVVPAGETKTIWIDTQNTWDLSSFYSIQVKAEADKFDGLKYEFSNSSGNNLVVSDPNYAIEIQRDSSGVYSNGNLEFNLAVKNTGADYVSIEDFKIDGVKYDRTNILKNHNYIIAPGETEEYVIDTPLTGSPAQGTSFKIYVNTYEGVSDGIELSMNVPDYELRIVPTSRNMNYGEIGELNPDTLRNLLPYNSQTRLYENGTMEISVKNTGQNNLLMQSILINNNPVDFTVVTGNYFLSPNEVEKYTAQITSVIRNKEVKITTVAINQGGFDVASDTAYVIPLYQGGKAIEILKSGYTSMFTHEKIEIAVRNVGIEAITMENFQLLGHNFTLDEAIPIYGTATMQPLDVFKFKLDVTGIVKLNQSESITLTVRADSDTVVDTKTLITEIPPGYSFAINVGSADTRGIASTNTLQLAVQATGEYNLTVDAVIINGTEISALDVTFDEGINVIAPSLVTIMKISGTDFGMTITAGKYYQVTVITVEGPKYTALVLGKST
jgi:dolichyl-diphosphooligosaccharide--protein glycosyltransferase